MLEFLSPRSTKETKDPTAKAVPTPRPPVTVKIHVEPAIALPEEESVSDKKSRTHQFEFPHLNRQRNTVSDALQIILEYYKLPSTLAQSTGKVEHALAFPSKQQQLKTSLSSLDAPDSAADEWDLGDIGRYFKGSLADFSTSWVDSKLPLAVVDGTELILRRVNKFSRYPSHAVTVLIPRLDEQVTLSFNFTTTVLDATRQITNLFDHDFGVEKAGGEANSSALESHHKHGQAQSHQSPEEKENPGRRDRWKLFLPLAMKNTKYIGIWLKDDRLLQSYLIQPSAYADSAPLYIETTLIYCREKGDLDLINPTTMPVRFTEIPGAKWWAIRLNNNKWAAFNPRASKPKFEKLRRFVRKGIPYFLRGDVWPIISGAREILVPGLYADLTTIPVDESIEIAVSKDIFRTFPDQPLYNTRIGIKRLRRVLYAYSHYEPEIGYCQGINFIVAALLMIMNEESAFWTFHALVKNYGMLGFYDRDISLLGSALLQFENCIKLSNPEVFAHFTEHTIPFSMFASGWFHTLFASVDAMHFLYRTWDIFLNEGWMVVFKIAQLFVARLTDTILKSRDVTSIVGKLKLYPKLVQDVNQLLLETDGVNENIFMYRIYSSEELVEIYCSLQPEPPVDGSLGMYLYFSQAPNVLSSRNKRAPSKSASKTRQLLSDQNDDSANSSQPVTTSSSVSTSSDSIAPQPEKPMVSKPNVPEPSQPLDSPLPLQGDASSEDSTASSLQPSPTKPPVEAIPDSSDASLCPSCHVKVTSAFCMHCGTKMPHTVPNKPAHMSTERVDSPSHESKPVFQNLLQREIWEEKERQRKHEEERKRVQADIYRLLHGNSLVTATANSSKLDGSTVSKSNTNDSIGANPSTSNYRGLVSRPSFSANKNNTNSNSDNNKIKPVETERAKEIRENIAKRIREAKTNNVTTPTPMPQRKVILNYYS